MTGFPKKSREARYFECESYALALVIIGSWKDPISLLIVEIVWERWGSWRVS